MASDRRKRAVETIFDKPLLTKGKPEVCREVVKPARDLGERVGGRDKIFHWWAFNHLRVAKEWGQMPRFSLSL